MKILFLTDAYPNYVPDLLLHGLRELLGSDVVDYPKKQSLYDGQMTGVTLPDDHDPLLEETSVDRDDVSAKLQNNFFDYVVADIRALSRAHEISPTIPRKLALIDGEDFPANIPPGPYKIFRRERKELVQNDGAISLPMALPKKTSAQIMSFRKTPKKYSIGFLGSLSHATPKRIEFVEELKRAYPDALLSLTHVPSEDTPRPQGRLGRNTYYQALQSCKVVLSLCGAGGDTFRFWENMATDCVHVAEFPGIQIPNPFQHGQELFYFSNTSELRQGVDLALEDKLYPSTMIEKMHNHLNSFHLTCSRAKYFLNHLHNR